MSLIGPVCTYWLPCAGLSAINPNYSGKAELNRICCGDGADKIVEARATTIWHTEKVFIQWAKEKRVTFRHSSMEAETTLLEFFSDDPAEPAEKAAVEEMPGV